MYLVLGRFLKPPWLSSEERELYAFVKKNFGLRPGTVELYLESLRHKSHDGDKGLPNNERLEFLGDAVLSMAISVILFDKYPDKSEGELTKLRSRIVNRKHLNQIAKEIGLIKFIKHDDRLRINQTSVGGNALEAVIGAIYLDHGYVEAEKVIRHVILEHYTDLKKLEKTDENYKSILLEWSQSDGASMHFVTAPKKNSKRLFTSKVFIDDEERGSGEGRSKKEAEQKAAKQALEEIRTEA